MIRKMCTIAMKFLVKQNTGVMEGGKHRVFTVLFRLSFTYFRICNTVNYLYDEHNLQHILVHYRVEFTISRHGNTYEDFP